MDYLSFEPAGEALAPVEDGVLSEKEAPVPEALPPSEGATGPIEGSEAVPAVPPIGEAPEPELDELYLEVDAGE